MSIDYVKRYKAGRKLKWQKPEDLLKAFSEYMRWVEENPLIDYRHTFHQGDSTQGTTFLNRIPTIEGFCVHCGMGRSRYYEYKDREEFRDIMEHVDDALYQAALAGAAAGVWNASIVARKLGLKENTDITTDGKPLPIGEIKIEYV